MCNSELPFQKVKLWGTKKSSESLRWKSQTWVTNSYLQICYVFIKHWLHLQFNQNVSSKYQCMPGHQLCAAPYWIAWILLNRICIYTTSRILLQGQTNEAWNRGLGDSIHLWGELSLICFRIIFAPWFWHIIIDSLSAYPSLWFSIIHTLLECSDTASWPLLLIAENDLRHLPDH